jgi:hypothetical protein
VNSQLYVAEQENGININQLEDAEEDEAGAENDYDSQRLNFFVKHPLDINGTELEQLPLIDHYLIHNLTTYRKLLGDIIDLHELQAVPGFSIDIIKSILPYVSIKTDKLSGRNIWERITKGEHSVLVRPSITPEIAQGFRPSSTQRFTGSRSALFVRYNYEFRNLLQYGFVVDKDPGERLLAGGATPDFVSFHLFARKIGIIKAIAIGDYTINVGQGLIHWQSLAFRKSSSVLNIKRQSEVLRPYCSAGEFNFHRGIAATISRRLSEITLFISRKNLTANIDDSVITSIITSGLHRTISELNDKNSASLFSLGAALKRKMGAGHIGLNCVRHLYSLPILKRDEWYNIYALKGREWYNAGVDYSYTFRNFHLFGEFAIDKKKSYAYINGVMATLSRSVDVAMLLRHISKSYQSVFGNAFTENTTPSNEYGFYSGLSLKPHQNWKVDLNADIFSFPWLKYRLDVPSGGFAYLVQVTWKPDRQTEIYSRFRYRLKPINIKDEDEEEDRYGPGMQAIQNWRTHLSYQVTHTILLRSRVELSLFSHHYLRYPSEGYLFYTDIVFKPIGAWLSGNLRFQAFEAENYDARIYAYENDVLFVSSTPSFYNSGVRCYMNLKAKTKIKTLSNSSLTVNLKIATTVYNNISNIGSGPVLISGNRISTIKLQVFLSK